MNKFLFERQHGTYAENIAIFQKKTRRRIEILLWFIWATMNMLPYIRDFNEKKHNIHVQIICMHSCKIVWEGLRKTESVCVRASLDQTQGLHPRDRAREWCWWWFLQHLRSQYPPSWYKERNACNAAVSNANHESLWLEWPLDDTPRRGRGKSDVR